ncbi:hypothetical protein D3C85_1172190 [compost metagenome]
MRLAPQGNSRCQTVKTDIHDRAVREGWIKGIGIFAVKIALVARGVLAVVDKGFAYFAELRQRLLQQQEVRQAGGFKCFKQHHLIFSCQLNGRLHFLNIRCQRFLANHMFFVRKELQGLRGVQGVWAGDIHRVNRIALRHFIKRGKQMFDEIIIRKRLCLFKAAGIDGGEFEFAGFMGGVNELARDPVRAYNCETYHKRSRTP